MAERRSDAAPRTEDHELTITRVFDAPRSVVFAAWTDPEQIKQWSCPHGFTITYAAGDARPGGAWRSCMRSPEGRELWLGGMYREVVENELLSFTHAWDGEDGKPGHETLVTVRFEDDGEKTRMTFRQAYFDSVGERDGHQGGWSECFESLAALLAKNRTR
jgi:uncharacterized protein YndB with AHSA1/START domain